MNQGLNPPAWSDFMKRVYSFRVGGPLVFRYPPSLSSPPYISPDLDTDPNGSLVSLSNCSQNAEFLWIQTTAWRYRRQILHSPLEELSKEDELRLRMLERAFNWLEETKRQEWERQRLHAVPGNRPRVSMQGLMRHSLVVYIMFIPVYLQTKLGLSRSQVQFIFDLLKRLALALLALTSIQNQVVRRQLDLAPDDVQSIYHILELDSEKQRYLCCAECYSLYTSDKLIPLSPPIDDSERLPLPNPPPARQGKPYAPMPTVPTNEWSQYQERRAVPTDSRCTFRSTQEADICGAILTSNGPSLSHSIEDTCSNQELHTSPLSNPSSIPFTYRSFGSWLSELLFLPNMCENLTCRLPTPDGMNIDEDTIHDIMESAMVRGLKGQDGKPFAVRLPTELRLCLGLFIDWYNARPSSLRGGQHSTGGIYIVILNLDPVLRYQQQYMYHLFIPGPREPSTEHLNNIIRPLISDLESIYTHGLCIPNNSFTLCRVMLAIVIADQLAARRIAGFAAVGHRWFCPYCRLPLDKLKDDFNCGTWPEGVTKEDHKQIVIAWRDAQTQADRDAIFERWGFRYTELIRLPYFDVFNQVIIEPFHAILANIAQPHCREMIGGKIRGLPDSSTLLDDEPAYQGSEALLDSISDVESGIDDIGPESELEHMVQRGLALLRREGFDVSILNQLHSLKHGALLRLCKRCEIPTWKMKFHGKRPIKWSMVVLLGEWITMQREESQIQRADLTHANKILSTYTNPEQLKIKLDQLTVNVLYGICVRLKIDTSMFKLQSGTVFPQRASMISAIINRKSPLQAPVLDAGDIIRDWQAREGSNDLLSHNDDNAAYKASVPSLNPVLKLEMRRDIARCVFPEHLSRDKPPSNLGSKRHGSLKAAQWRSVYCFTLLITLGRHWGNEKAEEKYQNFFKCFKQLTNFDKRQSHHSFLHLERFLHLYGPMPGWWAFAFERRNGFIQRTHTNSKPGEIEVTFDNRMDRLSNMDRFLTVETDPIFETLKEQNIMSTSHSQPTLTRALRKSLSFSKALQLILEKKQFSTRNWELFSGIDYHGVELKISRRSSEVCKRLVLYSGTDMNNQTIFSCLGYLTDIIQEKSLNGSEVRVIVCLTWYKPSETTSQPFYGAEEAQAHIFSLELGGCYLCELSKLSMKPVVFYPWSITDQLVIVA
ncbi:hypothetical protein PIIN_09017 [Serendipita indica DSM 11827]|uniref:Uncharacterized protein n=1 Tax=Serendipita indica (strain DSM 11827) TaxID=1109443 RepID=G4TUN9_SERID|nr:hypothetical protein PIIN_09017 [Serendipita indica DSM 11827]